MGLEFLHVFEKWADSYDQSVLGNDIEYKEVFEGYHDILDEVVVLTNGKVMEFGSGTGNLTIKLLESGHHVIAVEPSLSMRKIAEQKILNRDQVRFVQGDFLHFPLLEKVDTIVSTLAFHHLTDEEKACAIKEYGKLLSKGGKIVFADTLYESLDAYVLAIHEAEQAGYMN